MSFLSTKNGSASFTSVRDKNKTHVGSSNESYKELDELERILRVISPHSIKIVRRHINTLYVYKIFKLVNKKFLFLVFSFMIQNGKDDNNSRKSVCHSLRFIANSFKFLVDKQLDMFLRKKQKVSLTNQIVGK